MSAIYAAWLSLAGAEGVNLALEKMRDAMVWHGQPSGAWHDAAAGVGMGRILQCFTPESWQEEPVERLGNTFLVYDGRIDNRTELIHRLGIKQYTDCPVTDAQLILRAYEKWHTESPSKLKGDFAFIIWDSKSRTLFAARDPMGICPLYCYWSGRSLLISTTIKALLSCDPQGVEVNHCRIAEFLEGMCTSNHVTAFTNILRLPPGCYLQLKETALHQGRYHYFEHSPDIRFPDDSDYAEAFREIFLEAVRCRLRGNGKLGGTLSGGLDSSSITSAAATIMDDPSKFHVFSAIFPTLPANLLKYVDERQYMKAVTDKYHVTATQVRCDFSSPMERADQMFGCIDDLFWGPNLYIHWNLYSEARRQGIEVFLDGLDGDTAVSHGYELLPELFKKKKFTCLWRQSATICNKDHVNLFTFLYRFVLSPLLKPILDNIRSHIYPPFVDKHGTGPVRDEIYTKCHLAAKKKKAASSFKSARHCHIQAITSPVITAIMETAYHASAIFNIQARYPFFDIRLLEFCIGIPAEQKLHSGWTRYILRNALDGILPEKIRLRAGKANLGPAFAHSFMARDLLLIQEQKADILNVLKYYIKPEYVEGLLKKELNSLTMRERITVAMELYSILVLYFWHKKNFT